MIALNTLISPAAPEIKLVTLDPQTIRFDAPTYQFRANGDGNGITKDYHIEGKEWNPATHGKNPLLVHERLDGTLYVADGHHRLDFAHRLAAEGKGPKQVKAYLMREADGYTAQDVKVIAAYLNMANGHSKPIEAARVFKEARLPAIHKEWLPQLPMDKGDLRISYTLSGLSDHALEAVERADLPIDAAARIATHFTDPRVQDGMLDFIAADKANIQRSFTERVSSRRNAASGLSLR